MSEVVLSIRRAGSLQPVNLESRRPTPLTLVSIGVVAGALSGLLGVGGGVFIVPMLVLVAGFAQHSAHATSLAAVVPIAIAGSAFFGTQAHVDVGMAALLATGSVLGAPVGAKVMAGLTAATLRIVFGIFLIVVGVLIAVR